MTRGVWTVLGAGSALPARGLGPSGHLLRHAELDGATLFDCGPGTIRSLAAHAVSLGELKRVVITHFHIDHCLDLAALAFARRNPAAGVGPLEIFAPAGIRKVLAGLEQAFGRGAAFERTTVHVLEPETGSVGVALGAARLRWAANGHTADAISVALDLPQGVSVAYSGDTGPSDAVEALAREVDLIVCECSFPDEAAVTGHLTPTGAGGLAARCGARRLLLTHFYPMLDARDARRLAAQTFAGPIEIARDGSRHRF